jgi:hypothetical protein
MKVFQGVKESWDEVRWQMLVIFAFFSVISTVLVACASVALLNVVVRRENANLIQERIEGVVDTASRFAPFVLGRVSPCQVPASGSPTLKEYPAAIWPEGQSSVTVFPNGGPSAIKPGWLDADSFAGVVVDRGNLEIRSFRFVERDGCSMSVLVRVRLTESFLNRLSTQAGLEISGVKPVLLRRFRAERGLADEIEANFIPGASYPIPVAASARDWETGESEDWVICQLRPTYAPTIAGLSRMGMRRAAWISPFAGIALGLALIYGAGLVVSIRLSQRIVRAIDGLSNAAKRVGKCDFSVRLPVQAQDQSDTPR